MPFNAPLSTEEEVEWYLDVIESIPMNGCGLRQVQNNCLIKNSIMIIMQYKFRGGGGGAGRRNSVERATPGKKVLGSILAVLVGSVSV